MGKDYTISLGTIGAGVSSSQDGGETWVRTRTIGEGRNVRAITVYPDDPHRILAGSDPGIFRSEDNGLTWEMLDSPMGDLEIWSVAVDPEDTDTIFAGTRPEAFRSKDGGKTWKHLDMGVNMNCPIGTPRTTNIIVDPRDHQTVWAWLEVDGVYKSLDGGDSWVHLPDLGPDPFHGDIHGMALNPGSTTSVYATSPFGIATSTDEGESWEYQHFPALTESDRHRSYCRGMIIMPDDPKVMLVGRGDTIPGITGAILRTTDGGRIWDAASLPVEPNSVVYWLASHAAVPDVVVAVSLFGQIYLSEDRGDSWQKLRKEFGEIRSLVLTPN